MDKINLKELDLTKFVNFDGVYLIFIGEIYNYRQISPDSKSVYESIIHCYNNYDIEYTLNMLDGVFSFILYDTFKNIVIVARDPYGVSPLFYIDLTFSSSYNKNIHFEPGTFNIYSTDPSPMLIKSKCYTSFGFSKMIFNNQFDIYGIIYQLLVNSVKKRIDKFKRNICLLSGGLGSSILAGILKKFVPNLETYTVGFGDSNDLIYSRKVAEHLGTKHKEIIITSQDYTEAELNINTYETDLKFIPIYIANQYIKLNSDEPFVLFNGCGLNELTGGYTDFKNYTNEYKFDQECKRLLNHIHLNLIYSNLKFPFLDRSLVQTYLSILPEIRSHVFNNQSDKFLIRATFEFIDKTILPIDILTRPHKLFEEDYLN